MYDRILVPTDGSSGAMAAADHAIDVAAEHGATVHVLYAVPPNRGGGAGAWADAFGDSIEGTPTREYVRERGGSVVREVAERADARGVDHEMAVVDGRPAEAICEYADDHDVDLVVMGTHGRTGLSRYLLGSVTEQVVRTAPAPVLTIRPKEGPAITDAAAAKRVAREALAEAGHESIRFPEEPSRQRATWVVRARTDDATFNVHVGENGNTSIARISAPE